jgi:hypothetical protein
MKCEADSGRLEERGILKSEREKYVELGWGDRI